MILLLTVGLCFVNLKLPVIKNEICCISRELGLLSKLLQKNVENAVV